MRYIVCCVATSLLCDLILIQRTREHVSRLSVQYAHNREILEKKQIMHEDTFLRHVVGENHSLFPIYRWFVIETGSGFWKKLPRELQWRKPYTSCKWDSVALCNFYTLSSSSDSVSVSLLSLTSISWLAFANILLHEQKPTENTHFFALLPVVCYPTSMSPQRYSPNGIWHKPNTSNTTPVKVSWISVK